MFKIGDKVKHPDYPKIYEVVAIRMEKIYEVVATRMENRYDLADERGIVFRGYVLDGYEVMYVPITAELVLKKVAIIEGRWKTHYEKQAMSKL